MILVGTKCDEEEARKVKTEVAQKYVDDLFKECIFIETSAKTNHNVQEAFQVINPCLSFAVSAIASFTIPMATGACCACDRFCCSRLSFRLSLPTD